MAAMAIHKSKNGYNIYGHGNIRYEYEPEIFFIQRPDIFRPPDRYIQIG